MNTSHGGGAFAQQRKSIKKKRERSEIESKNTNINEASERGDDTVSVASGKTGKNTINIQVPMGNQNSNSGVNSAIKRINSNAASGLQKNRGGVSPDLRLERHMTSKTKNAEVEPSQSEIEAYLYKEQFISYCKDILTRPKRKQQNINELSKQQNEEPQSVDEIGKFVHTSVKKTLHGDEKYDKMLQQ